MRTLAQNVKMGECKNMAQVTWGWAMTGVKRSQLEVPKHLFFKAKISTILALKAAAVRRIASCCKESSCNIDGL